ncbi:MAG TPA: DUF1214 domain-containing protein [Acidimicrobiales bacterium]|nr:DUF1214 domain-containing protein [Acidimicrobiales bacterium]
MWNPGFDVREDGGHDVEVTARTRPLGAVPEPTTPTGVTLRANSGGVASQPGFRPLRRWEVPLTPVRSGEGSALPALVTGVGLVATPVDENIYSTTYQHVDGAALDGSCRYELRFHPAELADAGQFWSLTMYGLDLDLADKRIDRHSISDRTPGLRADGDGGMTLVLQHERPDDEGVLNWIPAPEGRFCLIFRAYGPAPSVDDGAWIPPAVRLVA